MNRRQLLTTTGAVASLCLCAGIVGGAPGCTPAPAAEPDPLLKLVNLYRATVAELDARFPDLDDEFEAEMDRLVYPLWRRLKDDPPAATTEAGALAALRLAHEVMQHSHGSFEEPLVGAALAYFEGRA